MFANILKDPEHTIECEILVEDNTVFANILKDPEHTIECEILVAGDKDDIEHRDVGGGNTNNSSTCKT